MYDFSRSNGGTTPPPHSRFAHLDSGTMTSLMLNPNLPSDERSGVIEVFKRLSPDERGQRLHDILRVMVTRSNHYTLEFMMSIVELLATDPEPEAADAMIRGLDVIAAEHLTGEVGVPDEFRAYFYETLMTRKRDGDKEVWRRRLPELGYDVLLMLLTDPVAVEMRGFVRIELLLDHMPVAERRKLLREAVMISDPRTGMKALRMLLKGGGKK